MLLMIAAWITMAQQWHTMNFSLEKLIWKSMHVELFVQTMPLQCEYNPKLSIGLDVFMTERIVF